MSEAVVYDTEPRRALRVAIEGCGHGTLDAIYAAVQKSCEDRGWDGVDLVIIGGDFQAVRDRLDLNVTAMPAKYRQMGDFHQYYWGTKLAPYLTIFIGGNHEASNHLYELYYGGWAAPNIYFLGAANVIQVGPLKIAGLSGIWKGYDYRKPHYERLPYNESDLHSIYHVRELDVRKLLAYRSQVDIGLSHDWPQGMEWLGDHDRLFTIKKHLKEDAISGRLGNVAAMHVLDHLRPLHWFSAHLHVKYWAVKEYEPHSEENSVQAQPQPRTRNKVEAQGLQELPIQSVNQPQISAWQNFHVTAKENEAKETESIIQEQRVRRDESERSGVPISASYVFDETYKRLKLDNGTAQAVSGTFEHDARSEHEEAGGGVSVSLPQADGCCESLPIKRLHNPTATQDNRQNVAYTALNGGIDLTTVAKPVAVTNPDAIDIDMSDEDSDDASSHLAANLNITKDLEADSLLRSNESFMHSTHRSSDEEQVTVGSSAFASHFATTETKSSNGDGIGHSMKGSLGSLHDTGPGSPPLPPIPPRSASLGQTSPPPDSRQQRIAGSRLPPGGGDAQTEDTVNDVTPEMRAQLAKMSATFAEPSEIKMTPALPHPEAITNRRVQFLALGKYGSHNDFLQVWEIEPLGPSTAAIEESLRLRYDPEWLAIQRVFASELSLGGSRDDQIPKHRGDTYYRQRILEEEKWIHEHVVQPSLLDIPLNFTVSEAANSDPDAPVGGSHDMPREVTNPQTTAYCDLIGIQNQFDISEAERDARIAAGPPPSSMHADNFRGGRGRGGRRGGPHRRGGYNGGGGRGGRGGRGRW